MKKHIFYTLPFLIVSLLFSSCDDTLDEVKDEIQDAIDAGEIEDPNLIESSSLVYTLTEDDYETLNISAGYFDSLDDVKALMPAFLSDLYPALSDNGESLVTVGFDLNTGDAYSEYSLTASEYTGLRTTDYTEADDIVEGFETSLDEEDIQDYIATVLATNNPTAVSGDAIVVSYNTFEEVTKTIDTDAYYEADLTVESVFNGFESVSVTGDATWYYSASYGAVMNGYSGGTDYENEDWFISPEIDLTGVTDPAITINQALNYLDGDNRGKVMISTNHTVGNYASATWSEIVFSTLPTGSSWSYVQSDLVDLSAYAGETVHLALVYDYPDGDTPTWEIDNITIQPLNATTTEIEYEEQSAIFVYTGSAWEVQEPIELATEDYDAMGESYGSPGYYNNFDSNMNPDNYLPTFLNVNYPYATEGDIAYVAYAYYDGGATTKISVYNYSGTTWLAYNGIEAQTLQFGLEEGIWVPDNTIAYTLVEPTDYDIIVTSELAEDTEYANAIDNMSDYSNFDRRVGNTDYWSDEMVIAALIILLEEIAPDAEIGQKYSLTFATWNPGDSTETFKFIKNDSGEWVSNND